MALQGSCLCGTVRYEIHAPFQLVGNCHCGNCRKASGAAFVTWGILAPGSFRWSAGAEQVQSHESSPGTTRCFCRRCGSSLAAAQGGVVAEVCLGTLESDPGVGPSAHIFVGSKAPWHRISDALPQHQEWPPGLTP